MEVAPPLAVVTQPDRPAGRKQKLRPGPLAVLAKDEGLPLIQPEHLKEKSTQDEILSLGAKLLIVVSFGQIIPRSFLERCPPIINGHASLLPKYRGASPIQSSILGGDEVTGMTIMHIVPPLDAGPMISKEELSILPTDNHSTLSQKLIEAGIRLLRPYVEGDEVPAGEEQDEGLSTHCSKLTKEDAHLRPDDQDGETLSKIIRAFSPVPGAHLFIESPKGPKRLKILKASLSEALNQKSVPGFYREGKKELFLFGQGGTGLIVEEVQPEGKGAMAVGDFLNGVQGDLRIGT